MVTRRDSSSWSALLTVQQIAHASVQALTLRLPDLGLTGSEINALGNLASGGSRTVSALAAAAGVRSTTMSSILDRLEQRGLIRRRTVAGDRRAVRIELTAAGQTAAAAVRRECARLEDEALGRLEAGAVAGLRAGLDALAGVAP